MTGGSEEDKGPFFVTSTDDVAREMRNRLERDHGGKLLHPRDLPDAYSDLKHWMSRMRYGHHNFLAVMRSTKEAYIKWYTATLVFTVLVQLPGEHDKGFIGGEAKRRTPHPGETWTRSADLFYGAYCEDTWNRILANVVGFSTERLEIHVPYKDPGTI